MKDGRLSVNRANSSIKPHVYDNVDISVRDFSPTSQFPFTITANLPAGGTAKLEGKAGPINSADVSASPIEAQDQRQGSRPDRFRIRRAIYWNCRRRRL